MFREFHFVLSFLKRFISENKLVAQYQELVSDIQSLQTISAEELKNTEAKISESKSRLISIHKRINPLLWSPPQTSILEHISATEVIGNNAGLRIHEAFQLSTGNSKTIIEKLNQLVNETNELNTRVQQLFQHLNLEEEKKNIPEGQQVFQLVFDKNAGFSNFWESEDRSKTWRIILRSVADLTGENFEDIKVVSWNSSSPEIGVWIAANIVFISAILSLIQIGLDLKSIKDSALKHKQNASNLEIGEESLKVIEKEIDTRIGNIYHRKKSEKIIELRSNHGSNSNRSGKDGDSFLSLALEKIVKELGDGVRVIDPNEVESKISEPTGEDGAVSLGNSYAEDLKLESQIDELLEERVRQRLQARSERMKREIESNKNRMPLARWSKEKLVRFMQELDLDSSGTKKEILERYKVIFGAIENKDEKESAGEEEMKANKEPESVEVSSD